MLQPRNLPKYSSLPGSHIFQPPALETLGPINTTNTTHRRRRWGGGSLKFGKIFFGQLLCKILAFFGQNRVKFGNFVNLSGKYDKNCIFRASWKNHVKFGHFVNFSYIFFGQKCRVPLKLTELPRDRWWRLPNYVSLLQLYTCMLWIRPIRTPPRPYRRRRSINLVVDIFAREYVWRVYKIPKFYITLINPKNEQNARIYKITNRILHICQKKNNFYDFFWGCPLSAPSSPNTCRMLTVFSRCSLLSTCLLTAFSKVATVSLEKFSSLMWLASAVSVSSRSCLARWSDVVRSSHSARLMASFFLQSAQQFASWVASIGRRRSRGACAPAPAFPP